MIMDVELDLTVTPTKVLCACVCVTYMVYTLWTMATDKRPPGPRGFMQMMEVMRASYNNTLHEAAWGWVVAVDTHHWHNTPVHTTLD